MKKSIILFCLSIVFTTSFAQKMRDVKQEFLGVKYSIPKNWGTDAFGTENWEERGGSVCECSGVIIIGNQAMDDEFSIIIYPSKTLDSLDAKKRLFAWNMPFDIENAKTENPIKTEKLQFEKKVSKWNVKEGDFYFGKEVWQLKTNGAGNYYMIYIWATPEVMIKNEKLIQKILETFEPIAL